MECGQGGGRVVADKAAGLRLAAASGVAIVASMQLVAGETRLELGGFVRYEPVWLAEHDAHALFRALRSSIAFDQGAITLFGRKVAEPRLSAWIGDGDYTYSGRTVRASPWPGVLAALRDRLERETRSPYNAVLLNLYRDGGDSMGLHSDDEPELGDDPLIASVSLGTGRRFVLVPKKNRLVTVGWK